MLKIVAAMLLVSTSLMANAQTGQYVLNDGEGCYVKEYVNKKFIDVPYDQFQDIQLQAKPHSQNKNFMLFKANSRLYATLKRCLTSTELEGIDEQEFSSLGDSGATDVQPKKNVSKESNRKFYLELGVGSFFIPDTNPVYPDWSEIEEQEFNGQPITLNQVHKKEYESKVLVSLGGGRQVLDDTYLGFKFKYYEGKKEDKADITVGGMAGIAEVEFKDKFMSFLVGGKKLFLKNSEIRPFVGLYAGPSMITTKVIGEDTSNMRSISVSAQLDLGLEYFIKENIALTATYSYEYLGKRKFKEIDKDKNESEFETGESFTSKMDYSNSSFLIGAKVYFN